MKHIYNLTVTFLIMVLLTTLFLLMSDRGINMMHDKVAEYIDKPKEKGYDSEVVQIKKVDLYILKPEPSI